MASNKKRFSKPSFLQLRKSTKKPGESPGSLTFTGVQRLEDIQISLVDYDQDQINFYDLNQISESRQYLDSPSKTWINIKGLHDTAQLKEIWEYFQLHPLIQEDILNTSQRPKIEEYPDHIYIVMRMINYLEETSTLNVEQVSIVLGDNYVLSFQESDFPIFEPVIERLKKGAPRLRKSGTDYLAYALTDTIVDHYLAVNEKITEEIEELEGRILEDVDSNIPEQVHSLRRQLIFYRKALAPFRDSLSTLVRDEFPLIQQENKIFFRDVHDHLVQIIEAMEQSRDTVKGLLEMYMSQVSYKMNEVMKVLTIIATIFIPLTFIAGIYGMNFEYMPELGWRWAYPAIWVLMVLVTIGMLFYFKRKKWL